jgi:hypothetical protein
VGPVLSLADGLATALVAAGPDAPALLGRWRSAGWRGCIVPATGEVIDPDGLVRPLAPTTGDDGGTSAPAASGDRRAGGAGRC